VKIGVVGVGAVGSATTLSLLSRGCAREIVGVRTVTYRLERIRELTGYAANDPAHRFTLEAAVLGARLLGWPDTPLSRSGTRPAGSTHDQLVERTAVLVPADDDQAVAGTQCL
jgi:threonine dehydrogenase-like Zn-dependent dehydrogenase